KPIANTQMYILDAFGAPVPVGVVGELYIAGVQVARGYLNREQLTAERFVKDPFSSDANARMYKTGDLARWQRDGNIEYLGRNDFQVKLRGFRIELGEIETRLTEHESILEAVVVAREDRAGDKRLVAYYTASQEVSDLRTFLSGRLPEYMVPSVFVQLEQMPLSPNGKLDRKALPAPGADALATRSYEPPQGTTEETLATIWQELLHVERIGRNDNFFEVGGHSLLATQLVSKIRTALGIELPLKTLFERTSIAQLAEVLALTPKSDIPRIAPVSRAQDIPLSFSQERLWFMQQLEPESAGFNIPGAVVLRGAIDADRLDQAFALLIERHESLRTVFPIRDGRPHQRVLDRLDFQLDRVIATEDEARRLCQEDAAKPFDLANGPLLRGKVITVAADEHVLMLNMHHIISDGWSLGILLRELGLILEGHAAELPALPIQYADYSVWQRNWLEESGVLNQQLSYWQLQLAGAPESIDLATDYARPTMQSFAGATHAFALDAPLVGQLQRIAEERGVTLYMVLLAAFQTLLHRYTGQEDISVGSPIANRRYAETEGLIGMFVNMLTMRSRIDGNEPFSALLAQIKETCLEAYEHQDAPFEKVVDAVRPQRNLAISPLFQVAFILQNVDMGTTGANTQLFGLDNMISKYDLTLSLSETGEGLSGMLEYSTALYKPATIARMANHFATLCAAITQAPEAKLGELSYLGETEKHHLLAELNATHTDYRTDQCLHELFLAQVDAHANDTAVISGDERLTYRELHERARALALYLQSEGVQPDSLVGVCMERSLEMVIALYGILLAGGAYVPLDPDYPEDRLQHMVEDCGATIVLTQDALRAKLATFVSEDTRVITQWPAHMNGTLANNVTPSNLAYVIFTSGSTGRPKGVMNEHRGIVNRLLWMQDAYQLDATDA
ncbi:MAG: AMP-binding protein, partial [Acidobacteria bacterium]|nr:AMP-binding protein [Acidobacteriota bacterium]